ncbi:MAG: tetratricopeptide repeat protein [Myxococcales bacterium]|nr:tetratricopeptide repeat protein [Myxococcales bacterium]
MASASAAAAPCHTSLRALYERAQARARTQAARSRPTIASTELGPRYAAAAPGEHLRMYRATRAAAAAAGRWRSPAATSPRRSRSRGCASTTSAVRAGSTRRSTTRSTGGGERTPRCSRRGRRPSQGRRGRSIGSSPGSSPGSTTCPDPRELASAALLEGGLAHAQLGDVDASQALFARVVREHPGSAGWPLALLLRADFAHAEGRVDEARRHYTTLTRGDPGILRALAFFRLAHALLAGDERLRPDPEASLRAFVVAIAEARTYDPDALLNRQLRRDARSDLPRAYAAARGPEGALAAMRGWGSDAARGEDVTEMMGQLLAEHYLALDRPDAAASIYRQLIAAFPGDSEVCEWRAKIVMSTLARDEPGVQWAALQELMATARALERSDAPARLRKTCRYQAADYLTAMAGDWHRRGVAEGDGALRRRAEEAYRSFAQAFPEDSRAAAMGRDLEVLRRGEMPPGAAFCAGFGGGTAGSGAAAAE